jgi:hypothetical protein
MMTKRPNSLDPKSLEMLRMDGTWPSSHVAKQRCVFFLGEISDNILLDWPFSRDERD